LGAFFAFEQWYEITIELSLRQHSKANFKGYLNSLIYKTQSAVVERVCDENLEQGALYYQRGKYFAGLQVFVENFAAQILQPP
jgi:hypothetical protein